VSSVEGEAGTALAPHLRAEGESAYILTEDSANGRAEAEAFRRAFTDLGGDVVGEGIGGPYGTRLQQARSVGAQGIFAACSGQDATDLLEAYRVANMSAKLMGPMSLTETVDLPKLSALPPDVFTASFYAPDLDNEQNRRFVSSYHKAHGRQPSGFAMAGYDSASVLDKALRLISGDPTPSALNQAFSLLGQIESPRGTWTFNQNRTPQQKWYLRRLRYDGAVPGNMLETDLSVLS
jgi:branched-chain amino acid transport system substrate-binding protein